MTLGCRSRARLTSVGGTQGAEGGQKEDVLRRRDFSPQIDDSRALHPSQIGLDP